MCKICIHATVTARPSHILASQDETHPDKGHVDVPKWVQGYGNQILIVYLLPLT